ncbi:MAG TPA: hypothetical protein EYP98_07265, partial [Planctomycetes bacterium]|nr:hypothetical protein [Planctomycetota bacterium]
HSINMAALRAVRDARGGKLGFNANSELHGRVHAVLTYLDATGQLPLKRHDPASQESEQALAA